MVARAVCVAVLVTAATAGCAAHATRAEAGRQGPGRHAVVRPGPRSGNARAALDLLPVKGRAPMTGYSRDRFGPAWTDDTGAPLGGNGCDTRDDILSRDLHHVVLDSDRCTVESGVLVDPYTGHTIRFTRGEGSSEAVQIDHVASLGDDWQTGARQLSPARRAALGNDPLNLIATDGPTNEQKGDSDAASWLPPNKSFRCAYVARQIAVKLKYRLWVTEAESAAMDRVLSGCPGQKLPSERGARPRSRTLPTPSRAAPPPSGRSVYYPNCDAVRAAGKAPLHRGQPGYRPEMDGDGDGLACE